MLFIHFGMNHCIWLTTHLVIQALSISSGLCILPPSSDLCSKLWNMDYVSALHALSGVQVSSSGLSPSHFLLELCYTSHHLSLFPFLSSGFVLLIYQGSVYTPPRSHFWSPRCSQRLLFLLSTYLTHSITVTFFFPFPCLNSRALKSGTMSCSLSFLRVQFLAHHGYSINIFEWIMIDNSVE